MRIESQRVRSGAGGKQAAAPPLPHTSAKYIDSIYKPEAQNDSQ
jgi:hypothetical protein